MFRVFLLPSFAAATEEMLEIPSKPCPSAPHTYQLTVGCEWGLQNSKFLGQNGTSASVAFDL